MLKIIFIVISSVYLISCAMQPNGEVIQQYQATTAKPYADVLAELEVAISDHNFRITGHSRVGKVIRDRGTPDFPEYDTLQFCNLTHAKTVLLMSPHAIQYMPCNVVVYQFEGKTIIKTHLLPTDGGDPELNQFMSKMNSILKQIVDFAAEE
ncbi:MAG: DUF302 domain-containing protein [Methylococcales bacterium]